MYLYIYKRKTEENSDSKGNQSIGSIKSEQMVKSALKDYNLRKKLNFTNEQIDGFNVARDVHGKPYFKDLANKNFELRPKIHYSVSHSGNWWSCLIADEPVGFDIEICKEKLNYQKIAARFFTEAEYDYVQMGGLDSFFEVWVRKEAYIKYLGTGLSLGLNTFSVINNGKFIQGIEKLSKETESHTDVFLNSIEIHKDFKAAYCAGRNRKIKIVTYMQIY